MTESDLRALAERFVDAMERRDILAIADCFADGIRVWHNFDDREKTAEESLALLEAGFARLRDRSYIDRDTRPFPGGFVQQHTVQTTRLDGTIVRTRAALVCRAERGKITRIDEYFDARALALMRR